jgi:formate dehydrogenase iron-sulfur subunit
MPSYPSLDIVRRSATNDPEPQLRVATEVAKLIDVSKCIGCKACQSACNEWNDLRAPIGENTGFVQNPDDLGPDTWTLMRYTEHENAMGDLEWLIRKDGCMHCTDPGCLKACPAPGAIVQYANGIVDFNEADCIGCGYCVKGCPFDIPRYGVTDRKAYKCTLCVDRVSVGQEPACAKACPTGSIMFGTKAAMLDQAADRIDDLKSRGYEHAGVYNPEGVGGTHVMYVLHHADQPELYQGLPTNPRISPLVRFWKGGAKMFGLAAMGIAAVGGFLHYITVGPNEVPTDAERRAADLKHAAETPDVERRP